MQRHVAGELLVERAQELQKLLMPVARKALANHFACKVSRAANSVVVPLRL